MRERNAAAEAERQRARYHRFKSEGRCVQCGGLMLPEWAGRVHCPQCAEAKAARAQTPEQLARRRELSRGRMRRQYQADPVRAAAQQRERRNEKKMRGECIRCPQAALEDSNHCAHHRETERTRVREQARRRRAKQRAEQEAA